MRNLIVLFFALLVANATLAQDNRHPRINPEEFNARVEAYITEHARLNAEEARAIFPIFHEMKQKQREAMSKVYKMRRNHKQQPANEEDCTKAVQTMLDCNVEQAKIEAQYYKKMCKVIPACKVFHVKMADDGFHREMLHEMQRPRAKK